MYHTQTQTASDEERDARSLATGIVFNQDDDIVRQEYKQEADINYLLNRYQGQLPEERRPLRFGEQLDFDMDLLQAFEAIANARASYDQLPLKVRKAYPSITDLMEAVERGEVSLGMDNPDSEAPAGTQEPQKPDPAGAPPANPPAAT